MKTKMIVAATSLFLLCGVGAASADISVVHHPEMSQTECESAGGKFAWVITNEYPAGICVTPTNGGQVDPAPTPAPEPSPTLDTCPDAVPVEGCIPNIPPMTADDVVNSYPAPPVVAEPEPVPVAVPEVAEVAPVTVEAAPVTPETPVYAPDTATADRVAAGEELAYTGANSAALAVAGGALVGLGLLSIVSARRKA